MILTATANRKVNIILILPGAIDLEKFKDALSCTLQMYPHVAGQIRCVDGHWSVSSPILSLIPSFIVLLDSAHK